MFAGCVEENLEETIKVKEGDEIIFGARAGYENNDPSTKTIYKGTTYQVGDKTLEAVHWMPGDKVMIYCDQGNQTAHYQVTATGTGSNTEAETSTPEILMGKSSTQPSVASVVNAYLFKSLCNIVIIASLSSR